MTLIQWFNPMTWSTSQVANIISFFGSAGTIGALLYAFHLERKNNKKINDLANIARELQAQNEITRVQLRDTAHPKLVITGAEISGEYLTVIIHNEGKKAKVGRIKYKSDEVDFWATSGNTVLSNEDLLFYGKAKIDKPICDCRYHILFEYMDIYSNGYALVLTGHGKIITTWRYYEVVPEELL